MNLQLRGKVVQLVNNYDTSLFTDIFSKIKNVFKNLTQEQAISIANTISQINAPNIILSGATNIDDWEIPIIINDSEKLNIVNTYSQDKPFFITTEYPLVVKASESFSPALANGEYIFLETRDNFGNAQNIYKNIPKDTILDVLIEKGSINLYKQDFGSDFQQAPTINLKISNETYVPFRFRIQSQFFTKAFEDILPDTIRYEQFRPYLNWNYFSPHWGADLREVFENIRLELWKDDMSQLIATTYAYGGNNYQGWNWIGQINPSIYNNLQDYKLIIRYE